MAEARHWIDGMGHLDDAPDGAELVARISQLCGSDTHRERSRELLPLLRPQAGHRALEVGCGTGAVAREFVQLTGGLVPLTASDPSRLALAQAAKETAAAGLGALAQAISYVHQDGRSLTFPDESFAAVYSSRVLIHASEPERVVRQMARVAERGGRVLCIEPAAQFTAGVDDALRKKVSAWTNPDVARELPAYLRQAGLQDVTVTPHTCLSTVPLDVAAQRADFSSGKGRYSAAAQAGMCTSEEVLALLDQNQAAIERGSFLECTVHFAVLGVKP